MKLHDHGVYLVNGQLTDTAPAHVTEAEARKGTIAYGILKAHNTAPDMKDLRIKFDSMTSHDITMWASSRRRAPPAWKSSPCRMC